MVNKLNELEQTLQQLFIASETDLDRAAFDIGVEFGKELQRQGRHDYEFVFWKKLEEELKASSLLHTAATEISGLLRRLVCMSVKDFLRSNCCWRLTKQNWESDYDEFSPQTLDKYCVQIIQVNRFYDHGDFQCLFKVVGRLAKVFEQRGFQNHFTVTVWNEADEDQLALNHWHDIGCYILTTYCHLQRSRNWNLEQLTDLHTAICSEVPLERT